MAGSDDLATERTRNTTSVRYVQHCWTLGCYPIAHLDINVHANTCSTESPLLSTANDHANHQTVVKIRDSVNT